MDKNKLNEIISNVIYQENQKALDAGHDVLCNATEYLADKITETIMKTSKQDTSNLESILLIFNDYIDNNYEPSKTRIFTITNYSLTDFLIETNDSRTISEFLNTYDSKDSEAVYEYASNMGGILSEEVIYCDDCVAEYKDYRRDNLNPVSIDEFYWMKYANR